jgi:phosphoserine phosphatase RsbU/P
MEIWGGNRAVDKSFEAPGLDLYVFSAPYQGSKTGGGDIYYCTSCASGRITRILLADVAGHGESASKLAIVLRDLLRENVNTISQERFIEAMNREFGKVAEESCFATAVVATFFEPTGSFTFGLAGHPHPIYYRAASRSWSHLVPQDLQEDEIGNLPLGIVGHSIYTGQNIVSQQGDMFLLYSDAFMEAVDRDGNQLGISGLVRLLNEWDQPTPLELIPLLRKEIQSMSDQNLIDDDATIFLGHFKPNRVRLIDNFLAPFRLMGGVRNNTEVGPA